jgi:hypothetical protein
MFWRISTRSIKKRRSGRNSRVSTAHKVNMGVVSMDWRLRVMVIITITIIESTREVGAGAEGLMIRIR